MDNTFYNNLFGRIRAFNDKIPRVRTSRQKYRRCVTIRGRKMKRCTTVVRYVKNNSGKKRLVKRKKRFLSSKKRLVTSKKRILKKSTKKNTTRKSVKKTKNNARNSPGRKSPPVSATAFRVGSIGRGLDTKLWVVKKGSNGVKRWVKYKKIK